MLKRIGAACAAVGLFTLAACTETQPSAQEQEQAGKQSAYTNMVKNQPAYQMPYSPTRNTIIAWEKKWAVRGKLAYTYITDGPNDSKGGYYVFVGPPVSYCVGITPPYSLIDTPDDGSNDKDQQVAAPGVDGAWYGNGGCEVYYGIDAVTGNIVTFSVGMGQNMFYADQPNARYQNAQPLGASTIEGAKGKSE